MKTLSWLLVSGILIFGAAYVETRIFAVSFMTAVWACALKTPVYWVHEALWERKKVS
jgi:uncharacterized membrane protein